MKLFQVQVPADGGPLGVGRFQNRKRAEWYRDQLRERGWVAEVVAVEL